MNIPILTGYFRYPDLAGQRTRGYFAAVPSLLPVTAVIDIAGTNPIVSATALFNGNSVPVVVTPTRITAAIVPTRQQEGQQATLQWTLRFAQSPTVVSYRHQLLVNPPSTTDPLPTLAGNPCNIACGPQTVVDSPEPQNLYVATAGTTISHEGLGFESQFFNGAALLDWCAVDAAGRIGIGTYTFGPFVGVPQWDSRGIFCVQNAPRTNSDTVEVQIDINPDSPTYGLTRTVAGTDATLCPLADTTGDWVDDGPPYCLPEPRTDCGLQQDQIDRNPNSPTYNTPRTITLPPTARDCEQCPPTDTFPDYQDTGEWRCVQPQALGRTTSVAEKRQIDRNPYSATFGEDQWVSIGPRPDLCPIDTNPNTQENWVDVTDPSCGLVTRCKFDPPRTASTRQKLQVQANPALPNAGTTRWVDLPPSPIDATLCPVSIAGVWIPVCPESIRCKFNPPRLSSMTERLEVDVNPNSPTFGMQMWRDYLIDETLCPIGVVDGDEWQISLHFRGADNFRVLEFNEKLNGLTAVNVFNNALGVTYQYAPTLGVANWASYPLIDLASLQTDINNGPSAYSFRVNVAGYAAGSDAGIVLAHIVPAGAPPAPIYATVGISQDFVVWHKDSNVVYNSVISSASSTFGYSLITSATDTGFVVPEHANLASLNAAIAALPPATQYGVMIFVAYASTFVTDSITVNVSIP